MERKGKNYFSRNKGGVGNKEGIVGGDGGGLLLEEERESCWWCGWNAWHVFCFP